MGLPQGHEYPAILTLQIMKEWIAKRVTQLLGGLEEEVLISMIYTYLEDPEVILTAAAPPHAGRRCLATARLAGGLFLASRRGKA